MSHDHTDKQGPSDGATDGSGELAEEQLDSVQGGTAVAAGVKGLSATATKKPVAGETAQTMTAIALAESGGSAGG